ncbi:uncharacterized protein J3R85_019744 [Psidium guajava]|nr:uncharacterized protein J3R85_019744 [Psidium guajava]
MGVGIFSWCCSFELHFLLSFGFGATLVMPFFFFSFCPCLSASRFCLPRHIFNTHQTVLPKIESLRILRVILFCISMCFICLWL